MFFTSLPISCIATFDKDATYEYLMNEKESQEFYRSQGFTGTSLDGSFVPSKTLRILENVKANFHYLYHTTQRGWDFCWKKLGIEAVNSIICAAAICTIAFGALSGVNTVHEAGYTYDFWMSSFTIYASAILMSNVVIVCRASQISWFLLFWVFAGSIIPFYVISFFYDTMMNLENGSQFIILNIGTTYHYYLVIGANMMVAFMIEMGRRCGQAFYRLRLADYFKLLINNGLDWDPARFNKELMREFADLHDPPTKKKRRKSLTGPEYRPLQTVELQPNQPALGQLQPAQPRITETALPMLTFPSHSRVPSAVNNQIELPRRHDNHDNDISSGFKFQEEPELRVPPNRLLLLAPPSDPNTTFIKPSPFLSPDQSNNLEVPQVEKLPDASPSHLLKDYSSSSVEI